MEKVEMSGERKSIVKQWAMQIMQTDEYLIERITNDNDRYAAEILLDRHYKYIYKHIYSKVSDKEQAMDLTQDTFMAVLRALRQFDAGKASFKTWLIKIADNKVIDYTRSKYFKQSLITEVMVDDEAVTDGLEEQITYKIAGEKINTIIEEEGEIVKKIFVMKAKEGYTFAEISERVEMPVSTVKSKYYALVKILRKEMHGYE